jgi:hypothetical protein
MFDDTYYNAQSRDEFFQQVFGFASRNGSKVTQLLGSVETRQGRLLTFANVVEHRVAPFSLSDPSKPGHRKILVFYLVDPRLSIISSANVPPQQEDWARERLGLVNRLLGEKLPPELQDVVKEDFDFDPVPITMEEAKQYRKELLEERLAMLEEYWKVLKERYKEDVRDDWLSEEELWAILEAAPWEAPNGRYDENDLNV